VCEENLLADPWALGAVEGVWGLGLGFELLRFRCGNVGQGPPVSTYVRQVVSMVQDRIWMWSAGVQVWDFEGWVWAW
jgi:hypothetical protein